jgi:hypothetical protein
MSNEGKAEAQRLRDLFEGAKGRRPKTDQELNEWLASPEGKAATAFESTSLSRWGESGRS